MIRKSSSPIAKLVLLASLAASLVSAETEYRHIGSSEDEYTAIDVINKSPSQLIEMRGYKSELHYAHTRDGYYIHLVNLINPKADPRQLKRSVIFNHGLLESSTIWLINSHNVKPHSPHPICTELPESYFNSNASQFVNGPMLLANHGYDVWLMSMRGTDWSQRHDRLSPKKSKFWNYCLDDFAQTDVPTVVDYVREFRGVSKVAYIGHSQATFSVFGLLSARPHYADRIEPVIAVAPVAYFDHITSLARILFIGTLTATNKDDHGPFPPEANVMRKTTHKLCDKKDEKHHNSIACKLIGHLISGKGDNWLNGYYNHLPFFSSLKVVRHFGQLIRNKRFMMYDYGSEENLRIYGQVESPNYPIERIRSRALVLISTRTDALSHPDDVAKFKARLRVPLYRDIFIDREFDHFDLITHQDAKTLVFGPTLKVMEEFELRSGECGSVQAERIESEILNDSDNSIGGDRYAGSV